MVFMKRFFGRPRAAALAVGRFEPSTAVFAAMRRRKSVSWNHLWSRSRNLMVLIYFIFEFHETTKGFEFSCPRNKSMKQGHKKKSGFYLKLTAKAKPSTISFNFFSELIWRFHNFMLVLFSWNHQPVFS